MTSPALSNTQLELLKAFRQPLNERDLEKLRLTLVRFFAEIAMDEADAVWEKEGWDEDKIDMLLSSKLRKRK